MSRLAKAMILIGLAVAIFGGGAFAAYFLFFKKPDYLTSKSNQSVGTAAQDPGINLFEQAKQELNSGDEVSCRKTLAALFESFPKSVKAEEARKLLGDMVVREYFSPGPDKTVYTVVRGDSIRRIAQKTKASVELIFKANSLDSLTLHPGRKLIIPHAQFSLIINNKRQDVTMLNRGEFFTWYKPLQLRVPPSIVGQFKIREKIAWSAGARVNFGEKNYLGSSRWIVVNQGNITLYSETNPDAPNAQKPINGIMLTPSDMEELFALVEKDTPVTIQ